MREVWTMMGLFWVLSNIHYNHCNIHSKVEELALLCPNLQMFYQFHGLLKSRECIVISISTSWKDYLDLLIYLISNQTISLWAICQNQNLGRILSNKDNNHQSFQMEKYLNVENSKLFVPTCFWPHYIFIIHAFHGWENTKKKNNVWCIGKFRTVY